MKSLVSREWDIDSLPLQESTQYDKEVRIADQACELHFSKEELQSILKRFPCKDDTVFQAAWGLLLATYGAEDKASWCTWRSRTLPVFLQANGDESLAEILSALEEQLDTAESCEDYSKLLLFAPQGTIPAQLATEWKLVAEWGERDGAFYLQLGYSTADK